MKQQVVQGHLVQEVAMACVKIVANIVVIVVLALVKGVATQPAKELVAVLVQDRVCTIACKVRKHLFHPPIFFRRNAKQREKRNTKPKGFFQASCEKGFADF